MTTRIIVGHVIDKLAELPDESVHCCVTSPPYYGLRDYGIVSQIGLESSPAEYIAVMVAVFREVRRVLRRDGTLWLNISDSYAGTWGNQGRKAERGTQRPINGGMLTPVHDQRYPQKASHTGTIPKGASYKPKDLLGIPWLLAFALRDDGWYLRSEIIWAKRAPMPESVTDRPTSAHEKVFLLSKSPRYFYDAEAVKEDANENSHGSPNINPGDKGEFLKGQRAATTLGKWDTALNTKRNMRNWWLLGPEPFPEAHFATFPTEIPRRAILAGTSERGVCPQCGAPWAGQSQKKNANQMHGNNFRNNYQGPQTIGWQSTCEHAALNPVPATALDPFFGAGTTGLVADQLGRDCIGIELNPAYSEMARCRIVDDAPLFAQVAAE